MVCSLRKGAMWLRRCPRERGANEPMRGERESQRSRNNLKGVALEEEESDGENEGKESGRGEEKWLRGKNIEGGMKFTAQVKLLWLLSLMAAGNELVND